MMAARATAPCRVDLAGGTLDLWPLSQLVDDAVTVNVAVDVMTSCTIDSRHRPGEGWTFTAADDGSTVDVARLGRRPERDVPPFAALSAVVAAHFALPPVVIVTRSDASRGSGLGGSSSLMMSLIAASSALTGTTLRDDDAVALACNLETRVLGLPAGSQDHWAAQCGGASILEYGPSGVVRTAAPAASVLDDSLVVADTRVEHHSGMNNWSVFRAYLEGDAQVRRALQDVASAAGALRDALLSSASPEDILAAARRALRDEWAARRRLSPAVTSPEVEAVIAAAEAVGGAAKVCGAGGGGCVVCLPPHPSQRDALAEAVASAGARVLPTRPYWQGARCEPLPNA